ncbi:2-hydroxychromene-2-carboxylate isomerase [Pseudoxanthomonas suwonensis]|uniref:2-hydroxychromene-2-carboxylate isomerase n=1 Tax=Pseudoxanthomonas suwonensis TaxID=314722 RepID=A0A0E3UN90_9GAMM|nr:2-hydroxychromene-2-carboxylate isomerase [Pseudoxanthomonas suwonensis]AKC86981.1 thioredoxin oxidoreductase [Pseudoxanthomonas suwonensis]
MTPRWYFDFVSPFSYLHWQKMRPLVEAGRVEAVPIVFGAVLHALQIRGPAEIPGKREFIYRQALWQARREGVPLVFPPAHPFNPLAALRLCVAADCTPQAIDAIFDAIWHEGRTLDTPQALAGVAAGLGFDDPAAVLADPAVKQRLRANTDAALEAGVFGVPTLAVGPDLFWGNDSHDLMLAVLDDPGLLREGPLAGVDAIPVGVERRR